MKTMEQISNQNILFSMLDSFGCKFQSKYLDCNSKMSYTKSNGAGKITTIISDDIDLNDVFDGSIRIEGMKVVNSWSDNGFNTVLFPVRIVTFE